MVQCDRCGKEFDSFEASKGTALFVVLHYPNMLQTGYVYDLCPECQEELKNWIEEGVQKND